MRKIGLKGGKGGRGEKGDWLKKRNERKKKNDCKERRNWQKKILRERTKMCLVWGPVMTL